MILAQFVYEKDRVLITINILAMILGSILAYFMFGHVRIRVATWLDPWSDINATGYQITQALFATASGDYLELELVWDIQITFQLQNQTLYFQPYLKKWVYLWGLLLYFYL